MRAHTITTVTRPRRNARYRVIALALGLCALAIPASAGAASAPGYSALTTGIGSQPSSQGGSPEVDSGYSALTTGIASPTSESASQIDAGGASVDSGYSALTTGIGSPAGEPAVVSPSPPNTADGFDWGDAALGAGAALGLVALGGAALLTVRRRTAVSPSASTS